MHDFNISYKWVRRASPGVSLGFLEASPAFKAFRRFVVSHDGEFCVRVGEHEATLTLDPDLSTVFRELPTALEGLLPGAHEPVDLDFFEEGTSMGMHMSRDGDDVVIHFETAPGTGPHLRALPARPLRVRARAFLTAWTDFVLAVLAAIAREEPGIEVEESFVRYRGRIEEVRRTAMADA